MEKVLAGLPLSVSLVYLDDILVPVGSFDDRIQNLQTIFSRLREVNLKLSPRKCTFFQRQLKFLGHIVSKKRIATDPENTNVSEVRILLGLCSYYLQFIVNFADIACPLHQWTEHPQVFNWNDKLEQLFASLKKANIQRLATPTLMATSFWILMQVPMASELCYLRPSM